VLKLAEPLQGFSGVSTELARFLERLINALCPWCGAGIGRASGRSRATRASVAGAVGLGEVRRHGELLPARKALAQKRWHRSRSTEGGLALLNGTQVSTALALAGLSNRNGVAGACERALSVDRCWQAMRRSIRAIHHLRGHDVRRRARCTASALRQRDPQSHRTCTRVQDPYSLRCHRR